ncbi:hypothetical protein [Roseospirillum parvum]|uniref:Yip1 domain-containing protein n=1 Tax=Roseospirillum parvum TaxID=83401 RepID=A0A1G8B7K6_9PROT|nr:hypothetical protein [Roseospirillum parvum]SDH29232.1 hypothetical protein SAMN05421742_105262 [Roseospirillum parvum]
MTLPTIGEVAAAIAGVARLIRLDATGFLMFDASPRGFWMSFWAAAVIAPMVALNSLVFAISQGMTGGLVVQMVGDVLVFAIGWMLYPLIMLPLADWMERGQHGLRYLVGYNWFQVFANVVALPLQLFAASGSLAGGIEQLLFLGFMSALLLYGWFMVQKGLDVGPGTGAALVMVDVVVSLLVAAMAMQLPGLTP